VYISAAAPTAETVDIAKTATLIGGLTPVQFLATVVRPPLPGAAGWHPGTL